MSLSRQIAAAASGEVLGRRQRTVTRRAAESSLPLYHQPPGLDVNVNNCAELDNMMRDEVNFFAPGMGNFEAAFEDLQLESDQDDIADDDLLIADDEEVDYEEEEEEEEVDVEGMDVCGPMTFTQTVSEQVRIAMESFTCKCECKSKISDPLLSALAVNLWKQSKYRRRQVVQAQLMAFGEWGSGRKRKRRGTVSDLPPRPALFYTICNQRVCQSFYTFIIGCKKATVTNAFHSIQQTNNPVAQYVRGLCNKGTQKRRTQWLCAWLTNYATNYGMQCPTGRGSRRDKPVVYLPLEKSKKVVFESYCADAGDDSVTFSWFLRNWTRRFPHVKVYGKRSNFCDTCVKLKECGAIDEYNVHIALARAARDHLRNNILFAQAQRATVGHFSFDFAQAVRLPLFAIQQSEFYFRSGLKVDIFGVADDVAGVQRTYVLPEGHWPGYMKAQKGANSIASMVWHSLGQSNNQYTTLHYNCDNCGGQNKNRFMMWFFAWLVLYHPTVVNIYVSFPKVGHTRMLCDACFGLVKRALKTTEVVTPRDVMRVIQQKGSRANHACAEAEVHWYNWKEYLGQYFDKDFPGIQANHNFQFSRAHPGKVLARKHCEELWPSWDSARSLLKDSVSVIVDGSGDHVTVPLVDLLKCEHSCDKETCAKLKKLEELPLEILPLTAQRAKQLEDIKDDFIHGEDNKLWFTRSCNGPHE